MTTLIDLIKDKLRRFIYYRHLLIISVVTFLIITTIAALLHHYHHTNIYRQVAEESIANERRILHEIGIGLGLNPDSLENKLKSPKDSIIQKEKKLIPALGEYFWMFALELITISSIFGISLVLFFYFRKKSRMLEAQIKIARANLLEKEQVYMGIFEQVTDMLYIIDLDMQLVLLNQHTANMISSISIMKSNEENPPPEASHYKTKSYIGKRLIDLLQTKDWSFVEQKIQHVIEHNSTISYYHSVTSETGTRRRLHTELIPIRNEERNVVNILGTSRDITKKTEFEQRMYQAEKMASIGTLAAGVSHEINNPLAIILGFTDLLLERCEKDSQEYEDLKMIEYNGNIAKQVVENLLSFARSTEAHQEYFDVVESINIVKKILSYVLQNRNIDLQTKFSGTIAPAVGDSREFQQVLFNLINNSIAAITGNDGQISINVRNDRKRVRIRVTDNGKGILEDDHHRVFDPFFSTKKEGEGTGLGLWLCYGIINKYGGTISFRSSNKTDHPLEPNGTTFIVKLPHYIHKDLV
ncbi:MAG: PAS domain S-box protein [Calditrichaeota bacterium]|nr:PAS domain S-box protein [Calditrichota bacterium]MBT7788176.1 PAS domain S-box protein [Calditrichota bacterium]